MFEVFCCPSTTTKRTSIGVKRRDAVAHRGAGVFQLDYGSATLAGLPKQLMDRLQSVQNADARLIFKACRRDHIQPLLRRLHWLRMPERISFRLAVLVYRCLHGCAPGYLASDLQRVSHLNAHRRLRSSTTSAQVIPRTVRSTVGDRTFLATAASVWNSLPESVRLSPSLQVFRSRLKTELFAWSYSHDQQRLIALTTGRDVEASETLESLETSRSCRDVFRDV